MISIERCRALLGEDGADLTNVDLETLRMRLYASANDVAALAEQVKDARRAASGEFGDALDERAAIREYDGGMPRLAAELEAICEIIPFPRRNH